MKKIYIIRHAKSSWKDLNLDDFDRPLNRRGRFDAPLMGEKLKSKNIMPDIVMSSSALRTKLTAQTITQKIGYTKDVLFSKDLYESSASVIYDKLSNLDDKYEIVFLFGHNTGINEFVENYVEFYENVPTCGIVEIDFNCSKWNEISEKNAKLISFDYPKNYK